jgi:signal transduction histidine kinase/CheY-like chemotaxis protein
MNDGEAASHVANGRPHDGLLRDLMSLMALPALWTGRSAQTVLDMVGDAVERMVSVTAVLAQVEVALDEAPVLQLKLRRTPWSGAPPAEWAAFIHECEAHVRRSDAAVTLASPNGELQTVRLLAGTGKRATCLWFASDRPGFPSDADLAVLRAAVTLTGTALNAARLDAERERASRAKDEFLAMLGHELRNPLAPIVTTLEIMKAKGLGALAPEHAVLERQAAHLGRLVDDLLDSSRITNGRLRLQKRPVALCEVLDGALEAARPALEARRQHVVNRTGGLDAMVEGDAERLQQVFGNLLLNAAKFTPEAGRIEIDAHVEAGRVSVQVRDTGRGIEPSVLARVFDLFTQGATTIDRSEGGLGIGLAVVRNLVLAHGGTVEAASAGPGAGATFTVRLPTLAASPDEPIETERSPVRAVDPREPLTGPAGAPLRVLVVDDNADARDMTGMLLELAGIEVRTAGSSEAALEALETFEPDACLLDIGLPRLDGYQLATAIRGRAGGQRPIRFFALTGYGQPVDYARSRREGFEHHLVKPVAPAELLAALGERATPGERA